MLDIFSFSINDFIALFCFWYMWLRHKWSADCCSNFTWWHCRHHKHVIKFYQSSLSMLDVFFFSKFFFIALFSFQNMCLGHKWFADCCLNITWLYRRHNNLSPCWFSSSCLRTWILNTSLYDQHMAGFNIYSNFLPLYTEAH